VLQELAEESDHVVFVTNAEPERKPADRGRSLTAEAEGFLSRMGVTHVSALTLFSLWKLSLQEPERAREQVTSAFMRTKAGSSSCPRMPDSPTEGRPGVASGL
jgi:hypothetical protein